MPDDEQTADTTDADQTEEVARSGAMAADEDELAAPEGEDVSAQEKIDQVAEELEEEYGQVPDIFVDLKLGEDISEFFLGALPKVRRLLEKRSGKANFYIHREPNDEFYLMLGPKPSEFRTQWVQIRNPQSGPEVFERYADDLLETVMFAPSYEEVDWNLTGDGVRTPMSLTKQRLVNTFFFYETFDPNEPHTAQFDDSVVEDAEEIARSEKPSL